MSTSAVSSTSLNQQLTQYFQTRQTDLQQLGQALRSGDLAGAQAAYNNITTLGQSGPFAGGNPFRVNQREQDFTAVGQALQSGDLAGAQEAFATLRSTFPGEVGRTDPPTASPASSSPASSSPASSSGPEIVLNLSGGSGSSSPEQITVNISNAAIGGEQISLSVGSAGANPQQISFNLGPNSNEQIILNLLGESSSSGASSGSTSSGSSSSTSSGGGLSVSA
jgi:hypothetical protein